MRFAVESWSPEYGAPMEPEFDDSGTSAKVDLTVEVPPAEWRPLSAEGVGGRAERGR